MGSIRALIWWIPLVAAASPAWGASQLRLGTGRGTIGDVVDVPLTLSSDGEVQGLVFAADWGPTSIRGVDLVRGSAIAQADVVIPRIEDSYAVLGVVMDDRGTGTVIPAGVDLPVAAIRTYSLAGTITEAVGAEFVDVHCEDQDVAESARPGELIIGILVDATPPFDGQYLPPTEDFLKLICVDFQVQADAPCRVNGQPAETRVQFCDGANGKGKVPTPNRASVANHSWPLEGLTTPGVGVIRIEAQPAFVRGDCNFSQIDHVPPTGKDALDISDAAAVVSYLFQTGDFRFLAPCLDVCDANDDGRVDLADSVYVLRYLFRFDRQPPEPFDRSPGIDPTPDRLGCSAGSTCP